MEQVRLAVEVVLYLVAARRWQLKSTHVLSDCGLLVADIAALPGSISGCSDLAASFPAIMFAMIMCWVASPGVACCSCVITPAPIGITLQIQASWDIKRCVQAIG